MVDTCSGPKGLGAVRPVLRPERRTRVGRSYPPVHARSNRAGLIDKLDLSARRKATLGPDLGWDDELASGRQGSNCLSARRPVCIVETWLHTQR
jgi:hypothetical protein